MTDQMRLEIGVNELKMALLGQLPQKKRFIK